MILHFSITSDRSDLGPTKTVLAPEFIKWRQ